MTEETPAIDCTDVKLRYPRQHGMALDGVNLTIKQGAICGLFGRNGAGKTSLMALLAGYRRPTQGSIRILGSNPYENPNIAQQVAFVYQKSGTDDFMNSYRVRDLCKNAKLFRPNWSEDYAEHLLTRFDLPRKKFANKLSKGQLAALRCSIGLASRTPLTIFDEAYLGMDPVYRKVFIDELLADYLAYPRTILFSTHYIGEMERLFSEAIIVDKGCVLLQGDADTLRESGKNLQDLFISLTLKDGETYDYQ
ncbi:ABC transporter [Actinomycetota bacterium]|nr:ABC transporter [Actinomycetota bacterium]